MSEQKLAANNFVIFNGCGNLLNAYCGDANLSFSDFLAAVAAGVSFFIPDLEILIRLCVVASMVVDNETMGSIWSEIIIASTLRCKIINN